MHPELIAKIHPDKPAIRIKEEIRTYNELDKRSSMLAEFIYQSGLQADDVMAIWAGNDIDFLTCCWAGQRSGLYYLPIAASLTGAEAGYILKDSGAKFLIIDRARDEVISDAIKAYPALNDLPVYSLSKSSNFPFIWDAVQGIKNSKTLAPAIEGGDMLYTSGTTGRPKGVRRPLTKLPLGQDKRRVERLRELFEMSEDTVFLSPAPLYHAAPLRFCMNVLRLGGTVALMPRFNAEAAIEAIMETRATHTQWVPTMFSRMLALPDSLKLKYKAPNHIKAIHAGAPCPASVKRAMIDWFGPILHEYYSGTESVGFTHIKSQEWLKYPGSVGKAWGCKIHILNEKEQALPAGKIGRVFFEGKGGLSYHNAQEKTDAAHTSQGWATMGDIGYLNEQGYLFLTDREAFTIVSGGVNIYPREIEDVLVSHPDVIDAAVFGVPDADFGEVVQAVISASDNLDLTKLAQDLFAICRESLAPFKQPKRIAFVPRLPLTDSGKVRKRDLQSQFKDPSQRGHVPERIMA